MLPGEGIGPEVTDCALDVLAAVAAVRGLRVEVNYGGLIGRAAEAAGDESLSREVIEFCENTFASGGAILNGPGGGRYVYELRRAFDLFFKISPIQAALGLPDVSPFRQEIASTASILITRENSGGIYQGSSTQTLNGPDSRTVQHVFDYSESQVRRFLDASAKLAAARSGVLVVAWKESGVPGISELWRDCALAIGARNGVTCTMMDIDLLAYRLIHDPGAFDVIAAPNLFGDVLADLAAALLGSRGLSFSGNFTASGRAVYQTNHGAAYDLAGRDTANPGGQILSLAMMLRESLGLWREATAIQQALQDVWQDGVRTPDVAYRGCRVAGTRELGRLVAARSAERLSVLIEGELTV